MCSGATRPPILLGTVPQVPGWGIDSLQSAEGLVRSLTGCLPPRIPQLKRHLGAETGVTPSRLRLGSTLTHCAPVQAQQAASPRAVAA